MGRFTSQKPAPKKRGPTMSSLGALVVGAELSWLDTHRNNLNILQRTFRSRLRDQLVGSGYGPEKVEFWLYLFQKFADAGGVTSQQWEEWIRSDDPNKSDPVPTRRNLRLVVNRKTKKSITKYSPHFGGDAA